MSAENFEVIMKSPKWLNINQAPNHVVLKKPNHSKTDS